MISNLLSIGNVLSKIGGILIAILVLMLMITIHELGHYIAGKILKFKINEFSIGFGKAIYKKNKKNGEVFAIRLIPLGGYCAFEGEDTENESADSFNAQAPWKRMIVLFCGAFFNFISAIIFSVATLAVLGNGYIKVSQISPDNTHIEQLQVGDVITHANGEELSLLNGGLAGITQYIGDKKDIQLTILRDGVEKNITVQKYNVMINGSEVAQFGISSTREKLSFGQSLLHAVPFSFEMAWKCLVVLGELFTDKYSLEDIGGPITTIGFISDASTTNMLNLLLLVPLIAVNLAVFNLLPIPALDGSKMIFVLIEWIRKKPINRELENKIHMVGLLLLFGFVIIVDALHLLVF